MNQLVSFPSVTTIYELRYFIWIFSVWKKNVRITQAEFHIDTAIEYQTINQFILIDTNFGLNGSKWKFQNVVNSFLLYGR